jgi:hypothetical protein
MINKINVKVNLLEELNYYPIIKEDFNYLDFNYFIVDAVKKSIFLNLDKNLFISIAGYVLLKKNQISFSNPFIFYCFNSYYKNNLPKFINFSINHFILIENIEDLRDINNFNNIVKKINLEKTNTFIVFFDIEENIYWPISEYLENYTTYLMLNLESFFIYSLIYHKFKNNSFIISDGNILKLKNILNFLETQSSNEIASKIIGVIKNQKENYYKYIPNIDNTINIDKYLYNIPYENRTAIIELNYQDLKVNTFYFNPFSFNTINVNVSFLGNSILRVENMSNKNSSYYLEIIGNFILDINKGVPSLYFRMPENNIILTKLENHLKKFIPNEITLKYLIT